MVATAGRGWKLAPSLIALIDEADNLAPSRSTASDGSIGDPSHASRTSDHNPSDGWVCAIDLTDDDAAGMNARSLVDHLVATRDPRVKYLIHEGLIWRSYDKPGLPAWTPQKYTGTNGHFKHAHVSIPNTPAARNDTSSWFDTIVHEQPAPLQSEEDDDMLMFNAGPGTPTFLLSGGKASGMKNAADIEALYKVGVQSVTVSRGTFDSWRKTFA